MIHMVALEGKLEVDKAETAWLQAAPKLAALPQQAVKLIVGIDIGG